MKSAGQIDPPHAIEGPTPPRAERVKFLLFLISIFEIYEILCIPHILDIRIFFVRQTYKSLILWILEMLTHLKTRTDLQHR